MSNLSILSLTSEQFASLIQTSFQKGYTHALKYYKELLRTGQGLKAYDPLEPQAKSLLVAIDQKVELPSFKVIKTLISSETEKYVLEFSDKLIAELVVIPMKTGLTLCLSSQVGCKMACRFCETGRMGKIRDLKVEEILIQLFYAQNILKKKIKNIVFMGMGEPFDNFENVTKALTILLDPKGFNFPPSHITVSTSGIVPKILEFIPFGKQGVKLAVSINGSNNLNRTQLMPINRRYDMEVLKQTLRIYTEETGQKILAEYVMIEGINDSEACSLELALYLTEIPSIINLIAYNAQSNDPFKAPEKEVMFAFQKLLIEKGYPVYIRHNKGNAIMAACGQLGNLELKKSLLQKH